MLKYLKKKQKIGILGGSFDPPHLGHLEISKFAIKKFKLNYLIWVVTKQNPFKKKTYFKLNSRISLCKKIVKNEKQKIKIEFLDKKINSSKTYHLIKYLKDTYIENKFLFLMGADSFVRFHKWYNWKKIPRISKIIIFDRTSYSKKALNCVASKTLDKRYWKFVNFKKINISSSKIRKI